eukprot:673089-Prymnesium_polylepis.1
MCCACVVILTGFAPRQEAVARSILPVQVRSGSDTGFPCEPLCARIQTCPAPGSDLPRDARTCREPIHVLVAGDQRPKLKS